MSVSSVRVIHLLIAKLIQSIAFFLFRFFFFFFYYNIPSEYGVNNGLLNLYFAHIDNSSSPCVPT